MDNTKDKGSRSSSKVNLNESSMPLLEDEEVTLKGGESKVTIEMDTRSSDNEKDDSGKEKEGDDGKPDGKGGDTKEEKEKKKKEKKEKKKKEKAEKAHKRTTSLTERLTAGFNILDRDDRNVNDHVNIVFEDVLAEPDANHGFDAMWRLAFVVFSGTKLWVYRLLSALLAIPCGIVWGSVFSLLTLLNVWLISPTLRTFDVVMHIVHRIWSACIRTFMDPIFQSVGKVCSNITINTNANRPQEDP